MTPITTSMPLPAPVIADLSAAGDLVQLGLTQDSSARILDLAAALSLDSASSVSQFGRDVAEHTSSYADSLLEQVRGDDLEIMGANLGEILTLARSVNLGPLSARRSRIPVIGPFIDRLRGGEKVVLDRFDTARQRIEKIIAEVGTRQGALHDRDVQLGNMFDAVREEYQLLGLHVAAGRVRLAQLEGAIERFRVRSDLGAIDLQRLSDMQAMFNALDIRVSTLHALQQSAQQTLPQIRMVQSNNAMLSEKFDTIREVTVPAWKRQIVLALSLVEQRDSIRLAQAVDETTNSLLRQNADQLHQNSVQAAKANQRLVIDVATLAHVQEMLIKSIGEVIDINTRGRAERAQARQAIEKMRAQMHERISGHGAPVERLVGNEVPHAH